MLVDQPDGLPLDPEGRKIVVDEALPDVGWSIQVSAEFHLCLSILELAGKIESTA